MACRPFSSWARIKILSVLVRLTSTRPASRNSWVRALSAAWKLLAHGTALPNNGAPGSSAATPLSPPAAGVEQPPREVPPSGMGVERLAPGALFQRLNIFWKYGICAACPIAAKLASVEVLNCGLG